MTPEEINAQKARLCDFLTFVHSFPTPPEQFCKPLFAEYIAEKFAKAAIRYFGTDEQREQIDEKIENDWSRSNRIPVPTGKIPYLYTFEQFDLRTGVRTEIAESGRCVLEALQAVAKRIDFDQKQLKPVRCERKPTDKPEKYAFVALIPDAAEPKIVVEETVETTDLIADFKTFVARFDLQAFDGNPYFKALDAENLVVAYGDGRGEPVEINPVDSLPAFKVESDDETEIDDEADDETETVAEAAGTGRDEKTFRELDVAPTPSLAPELEAAPNGDLSDANGIDPRNP